jgi:predicted GNAT family acetyltransferase
MPRKWKRDRVIRFACRRTRPSGATILCAKKIGDIKGESEGEPRSLRAMLATSSDKKPGHPMSEVVNNRLHQRFELEVEGHVAKSFYKLADGVITFAHTEVPSELGGRGIGSRLIQGALDQVQAEGLKVVAECPFVKAFVDKRPEYRDLLSS